VDGQPVTAEVREGLVEPFIAATSAALAEMAGTEVAVGEVYQTTHAPSLGDLAARVELLSTPQRTLVLHFPEQTAAALAGRFLAGAAGEVNEPLVRDCVGEMANVVAGQAKTLLADTPYQFTFSLPRVMAGAGAELPASPGRDCVIVRFGTEAGPFALQLFLHG
jgi:chemotaxis protein CheX